MKHWLLLVCAYTFLHHAYTQPISWVTPCDDENFCLNTGSCTEGNVLITQRAVTICPTGLINYLYRVDLYNTGQYDLTVSNDTCLGNFPVGTHRILWRATDNCGNVATCTHLFTVEDCSRPSLFCEAGFTLNIAPTACTVDVSASMFVASVQDNCTPLGQLRYGLRRQLEGTGFPEDTIVTFDQCDLGINAVELWVQDASGLTNQCNAFVAIQTNAGTCACNETANLIIQGCNQSAGNQKLQHVRIQYSLNTPPGSDPPLQINRFVNTADSCYADTVSGLALGSDLLLSVRAERPDPYLNGVSTFDLLQISRHILGIQPFQSIYQMVAADVDRSGTVTAFDIVETRKLILGIYDTLPKAPSWRFVQPASDTANLTAFHLLRDTYLVALYNLTDTTLGGFNFVGIKSGDVNRSASLQGDQGTARAATTWNLDADAPARQPSGEWHLPVYASPGIRYGWQMSLKPPHGTTIQRLVGIEDSDWYVDQHGLLHIAVVYPEGRMFSLQESLMTIQYQSSDANQHWEMLRSALQPEAYSPIGIHSIALTLRSTDTKPWVFPNPSAHGPIQIAGLPLHEDIHVTLVDALGRVVWHQSDAQGPAIQIPGNAFPKPGLYTCRIQDTTLTIIRGF